MQPRQAKHFLILYWLMNKRNFTDFISALQSTNASLKTFVDFSKCKDNVRKISIKLNTLNYLLGKKDLLSEIKLLFSENKSCFEVLPILIAVRDKNTLILNPAKTAKNKTCLLSNCFESPEKIYIFLCETGLKEIFENAEIKNLNDYVFGVEVGLDTNARKNRGGSNFADFIEGVFLANNITVHREVSSKNFEDLDLGVDEKRFDFVIYDTVTYLIETNFYNTGGSKLNEVARSYTELSKKISQNPKYRFVWITDGKGWLQAKNKLEEAYRCVNIYNTASIADFIAEVKNE